MAVFLGGGNAISGVGGRDRGEIGDMVVLPELPQHVVGANTVPPDERVKQPAVDPENAKRRPSKSGVEIVMDGSVATNADGMMSRFRPSPKTEITIAFDTDPPSALLTDSGWVSLSMPVLKDWIQRKLEAAAQTAGGKHPRITSICGAICRACSSLFT